MKKSRKIYQYAFSGELNHVLQLSQPKIVFTSSLGYNQITGVSKKISCVKKIVLLDEKPLQDGNTMNFKDFLAKFYENRDFIPASVDVETKTALIMYSSGTTGDIRTIIKFKLNFNRKTIFQVLKKASKSLRAIFSSHTSI